MDKTLLKNKGSKTGAKASLIVLQLSILVQLTIFFQTDYVLNSPIIPQNAILEIVRPHILNALIAAFFGVAALIFYFYSKFNIVIILCIAPLIWQQVYHYFLK